MEEWEDKIQRWEGNIPGMGIMGAKKRNKAILYRGTRTADYRRETGLCHNLGQQ